MPQQTLVHRAGGSLHSSLGNRTPLKFARAVASPQGICEGMESIE
jgi:hypothetical protein